MPAPLRFRAWDTETKRFIPCHSGLWAEVLEMDGFHAPIFVRDEREYPKTIVMQSTGLTDKNGKEVFEGDVVNLFDNGGYRTRNATVEWQHTVSDSDDYDIKTPCFVAHFPPQLPYVKRDSYSPLLGCDGIEIIGNIYENPELLPAQ